MALDGRDVQADTPLNQDILRGAPMADLLALSARFIDNDIYEGAGLVNRPTMELSELGNGMAQIGGFFTRRAIQRTYRGAAAKEFAEHFSHAVGQRRIADQMVAV